MFCKQCGAQLRDGVKFCTKCGAAIKPKPADAPDVANTGATEIVAAPTSDSGPGTPLTSSEPAAMSGQTSGKKIPALPIAAGILALCIAAFFLFGGPKAIKSLMAGNSEPTVDIPDTQIEEPADLPADTVDSTTILRDYLKSVLIPEKGVYNPLQKRYVISAAGDCYIYTITYNSLANTEERFEYTRISERNEAYQAARDSGRLGRTNGIFSVLFYDFDSDGSEEMLVAYYDKVELYKANSQDEAELISKWKWHARDYITQGQDDDYITDLYVTEVSGKSYLVADVAANPTSGVALQDKVFMMDPLNDFQEIYTLQASDYMPGNGAQLSGFDTRGNIIDETVGMDVYLSEWAADNMELSTAKLTELGYLNNESQHLGHFSRFQGSFIYYADYTGFFEEHVYNTQSPATGNSSEETPDNANYITSMRQISEQDLAAIDARSEAIYRGIAAGEYGNGETLESIKLGGIYLLTLRDKTTDTTPKNMLIMVYEIQNHYSLSYGAQSYNNSVRTYWFITFSDLYLTDDEILHVDYEDYATANNYFQIHSGIANAIWGCLGYETLDDLYKAAVTPYEQTYNHEDKILTTD